MTAPPFTPTGIRFADIEKRYGSLYALRRVSLQIRPGELVAFAGRNGSGKTTLLRIAARLVRASSGSMSFKGQNGEVTDSASRTGFVAHATMAYDELTAEENLLLFARLQGIADPRTRAAALLEELGLSERRKSLVRTFSRGMRQRVAIARALLDEPSVLLLDEPATGLDPEGITWLARTLRRMRDEERTILMSVHGESEISTLATRAVRLDAGSVVADSSAGSDMHAILTFASA
ncbi:MAG TPA: ATP-binding cassette domain-containing protein [Candidatus Sulfotelmatobacter sp.]|nr:ATP-binding cassette domain-containing protein [Candidatus Sulfotelmatobacter sp.]